LQARFGQRIATQMGCAYAIAGRAPPAGRGGILVALLRRRDLEMSTYSTDELRNPTPLDRTLSGLGRAFASLAGAAPTSRPMPVRGETLDEDEPSEPSQRRLSGALMRVNHVGEICAQALYEAQAASTVDP